MKKLLAIVLALVLALSMSAIAFATNEARQEPEAVTTNNDEAEAEVWVLIEKENLPDEPEDVDPDGDDVVYSVSIDATAADFTYDFGENPTYDPTTHKYVAGEGAGWTSPTSANIIVTNDSNTSVKISAAWKTGETGVTVDDLSATKNDVKATLSNTTFNLKSAVYVEKSDAYATNSTNGIANAISVAIDTSTVPSTLDNFILNKVVITVQGLPVAP